MLFHVRLDELDRFAAEFWNYVQHQKVFAFHGQMGAGKTTMINALCHYKGTTDATGSPTFSIINEYSYKEKGETKKIFHIDLYRLKDDEEVVQTGVEECVYSGSVCMVEWAEKAAHLFDEGSVHVHIDVVSEREREVIVRLPD